MKGFTLPVMLIVVIAGLLVVIGLMWGGKSGDTTTELITEKSELSAHTIVTEVLPIGEYATLAYHYTSVVKDINAKDIKGWTIPFTTRKYIFTYDGKIKLGIDGSRIRVEEAEQTENETGTELAGSQSTGGLPVIRIFLPPIKILSHEVLDDSIEIFEQSQTIFNEIKIADAFKVTADRKREMEEKVMAGAIVKDAEASTVQQLGALLNSLPGIKGKYELEFIWEETESRAP
jgi:hypothetical protein